MTTATDVAGHREKSTGQSAANPRDAKGRSWSDAQERLLFGGVICKPCNGVGYTLGPVGSDTKPADWPVALPDNLVPCQQCKGSGFKVEADR